MIVIDPRVSETAAMADIHLQVRPGTDAWCIAALLGILLQEDLLDHEFLAAHTIGTEAILKELAKVPVSDYAQTCGVPEELLRTAARRIGTAQSATVYEDLVVQQAPNSTLVSYLDKLLWILTGNFGKPGTMFLHSSFAPIAGGSGSKGGARVTPVTGARIISGLIPCNSIAEEILTDHPDRFRAMWLDSTNPAHSLADSATFRKALDALDLVVVVDVAFTETAAHADYVLPAASQFEKWEATLFNVEFPPTRSTCAGRFSTHCREPSASPSCTRGILRRLEPVDPSVLDALSKAAEDNREAFTSAFFSALATDPDLLPLAPFVLYETLGPSLPTGQRSAAAVWGLAQICALTYPNRSGVPGIATAMRCSTPSSAVRPASCSPWTTGTMSGPTCDARTDASPWTSQN